MTNRPLRSHTSDWERYRANEGVSAQAGMRARDTHQERREREGVDRRARNEGRQEKIDDLHYTRRERAAERERERLDQERRGIDPETERRSLAKWRRDVAAEIRDDGLSRVEKNRPDAITSAARQAAETRSERNKEQSVLDDETSAEYRGLIEIKRDSVARYRQYRTETKAEEEKAAGERRIAAAHMAREAQRARMLREMDEDTGLNSREAQLAEVKALAAIMSEIREESAITGKVTTSTPKPADRTPEQAEELIDRARENIAAVRKAAALRRASDLEVQPKVQSGHKKPGGLLGKVFGRRRRAV